MSLCGFDPYSPYFHLMWVSIQVLIYLKSKAIYPSEEIMKWTDRLESEKLPFECYSRTDKSGKVLRISSYKEKWYLFRTEALFKLEQYKTCLDLCEEALIEIPGQHFLNAIWFKRRKALCKWHLQDREEALCELKDVLNQKKEWFIQHEIAGFYFEQGQIDDALSYALDSALNYGETEFKWELFCLIGLILKSKGHMDIAKKHILLSAKVREEKGWKIPEKLALLIEEFNLDPSSASSSKELLTELKKHWTSLKFSDKPKFTGVIKKILPMAKQFIHGEKVRVII
jgi:tetratricopeptide (TPR) repeat protein